MFKIVNIFLLISFFSNFSFNSKERKSIINCINSQTESQFCLSRVVDWHKQENNGMVLEHLTYNGVRAFHTYPLALTAYLNKFLFNYYHDDNSYFRLDKVISTPGIILYKDEMGEYVHKVVAFEVGKHEDTVNHRVATTCPLNYEDSPWLQKMFSWLNEKSDLIVEHMKTIEDSRFNNPYRYPDGSFLVSSIVDSGGCRQVFCKGKHSTVFAILKS